MRVPVEPPSPPQKGRPMTAHERIVEELKALEPEAIARRDARAWGGGRSIARVPHDPYNPNREGKSNVA
jgi:hypothetical protein